MDQLRATAYLDLLNAITAEDRIAHGLLTEQTSADAEAEADDCPETSVGPAAGRNGAPARPGRPGPARGARPGGDDCPCRECDGSCLPDDDSPEDSDPDEDPGNDGGGGPGNDGGSGPRGGPDSGRSEPGDDDSPGNDSRADHGRPATTSSNGRSPQGRPGDKPGGGGEPAGGSPGPGSALPSSQPRGQAGPRPVLQDLIFPLATLLGLADKPGEGHGLGTLDPELCRTLAATAALSPHTTICVTITNNGIAIGHGCAKPGKLATPTAGGPAPPLVTLPAGINLTITADQLAELAGQSRTGWALAPRRTPNSPGPPGDPDWCGTWALTLPGGLEFTVCLEPVPSLECDHRHESHGYQPNDRLRHLVQVRDYTCTFPTCSRHARESDFEHAVPYDKGGRTCACNAGARSRKCHRVKQAPGWKVTQPRPGWHQWETPRGRTYTQGPKRYPV